MGKITFKESGMAIMTVLLLTTLLVIMTVSMIFISTEQLSMTGNMEAKYKAMKAAEAGIEYAINTLNSDPLWGLKSSSFKIKADPNNNYYERKPDAGCTIPFDKDCRFTITFDPNSKYGSINNLFEWHKNTANASGTPCYTVKIVSIGEYGPLGKGTKKIVEAFLVRSDYCPYNVGSNGVLLFGYANVFSIKGKDANEPGYILSNWASGDSIEFEESPDDPLKCPEGVNYMVYSNGGVFSGRGNVKMDPNNFDGAIMKDVPEDSSIGSMEVEKVVEKIKEKGTIAGTLQTVGGGHVLIKEVIPEITGPGDYYSTLEINSTSTDFTSAVSLNSSEAKSTLTLNKDLYVNGNLPVPGDKDLDYTQLIGKDNVLQVTVEPGASMRKHYVAKTIYDVDGVTPIDLETKLVDSEARDITLNLNGHSLASDSHLILGVDVEGEGKLVSKGKLAYTQGMESQDNKVLSISGDDLTVEVSDRVSGSYGKGLYYAADDITIRPMASDCPLRMDGGSDEKRNLQKHGSGKIITDTTSTLKIGGDSANPEGAMVSKTQTVGIDGTVTDMYVVAGRTMDDGTAAPLEIGLNENAPSGTIIPDGSDTGGECVCCHIDPEGDGSGPMNRRKDIKVNLETYKIGIKPDGYGFYTAVLLDENNMEVPVESSGLDLQQEELYQMGKVFGQYFDDPTSYTEINTNASIVSQNKNGTSNESKIIAGTNIKPGTISLGLYSDYMQDMLYLNDLNFKVRKVSFREVK